MPAPRAARRLVPRGPAAARSAPVFHRWLRPLLWSSLAASVAQLVLTAAAAAVTGGGDFPLRR